MLKSLLDLLQPSAPCERLRRVLDGGSTRSASNLDLAVLARNCLRHADLTAGVQPQWRVVEGGGTAVPNEVWARVGVETLPGAGGRVQLRANPWQPGWLNNADPFATASAALPRRNQEPVPGDPFLGQLGYHMYNSASQREAVRAALLAPPGSTLLVNLPTGMGKSLCGHALGVCPVGTDERNLTLVIVPTDALNIDQEERLQLFVRHRVAYRGSDMDSVKRGFAQRIYDNSQRILFAAPEAVCRRLRGPLSYAASRGWLRAVVIDEAHLVDAWGDSFRPEFQELPGLRRLWLRQAAEAGRQGFPTVLLSATVTPACTQLLRDLFPAQPPGTWAMVRDPQARPEPEYWFAQCDGLDIQIDRLAEAALHAPRPLLVYTTLKKPRNIHVPPAAHARLCFEKLREAGFSRLALFDGDTKDDERRQIVGQWARDELDMVVATSAFGLGVDKADVRAVIHCCVPEGVDRFYQEVGRGGRDGAACGSLVLHTSVDLKVARRMAAQKLISSKKPKWMGWRRWHKMAIDTASGAVEIEPGRWRLNAGLVPNYQGLTANENDYNVAWNIRTLQLMARSGLVALDAEPPPSPPRELNGEERAAWWDEHRNEFNHRVVRTLDQQVFDKVHWHEVVNRYRNAVEEAGRAEVDRMAELLRGHGCVLKYLAETYNDPDSTFVFGGQCGGCPACRNAGVRGVRAASDWARDTWPSDAVVRGNLATELGQGRVLFLTYPAAADRNAPEVLTKWLAENGVQTVVLDEPDGWGGNLVNRVTARLGITRFTFFNRGLSDPEDNTYPSRAAWQPRPTAIVFAPGGRSFPAQWPWVSRLLAAPPDYPLLLLIPDDLPDPDRRDRLVAEVYPAVAYATLRQRYGLR